MFWVKPSVSHFLKILTGSVTRLEPFNLSISVRSNLLEGIFYLRSAVCFFFTRFLQSEMWSLGIPNSTLGEKLSRLCFDQKKKKFYFSLSETL